MCGIVGSIGVDSNRFVKYSLPNLRRRGPDSESLIETDFGLSLGATRLAMTDPHPRSNQPMSDPDGNILVFNGEIYNFKLIRNQLERAGYIFRTESDTEVLLNLLIDKGIDGISQLEGMYAFAFYNSNKRCLILSRDFLGKKPLYYYGDFSRFLFASEINVIKNFIGNSSIDSESIGTYLRIGYLIDPKTMFKNIYAVEPGKAISIEVDDFSKRQIFDVVPQIFLSDSKSSVNSELNSALLDRVFGHEKFVISLSGGLDSAILAMQCAKSNLRPVCYSAKWSDSDKSRYNLDAINANKIAKILNFEFVPVEMPKAKEIPQLIDSYLSAMQEPNSNPTGISLYSLYQQISDDGFRLVLTGDGADEVFGGYQRYKMMHQIRNIPKLSSRLLERFLNCSELPRQIRKILYTILDLDSTESWLFWHEIIGNRFLKKLNHDSAKFSMPDKVNSYNKLLNPRNNQVASTMVTDLLIWLDMESNRKLDRISMWHSIEARSPFQSEKVIRAGYSEMSKYKFTELDKVLLRKSFPEINSLPISEKKIGFISPLGHWLRCNPTLVKDSIEILTESLNFDAKVLAKLESAPQRGNFSDMQKLWSLVILAKWLKLV